MEKYNGWSNYPTWNFKLWLDNDYEMYKIITQVIANEDMSVERVTQALELYGNEMSSHALRDTASTYADILGWAMKLINYREVAVAMLADAGLEVE